MDIQTRGEAVVVELLQLGAQAATFEDTGHGPMVTLRLEDAEHLADLARGMARIAEAYESPSQGLRRTTTANAVFVLRQVRNLRRQSGS